MTQKGIYPYDYIDSYDKLYVDKLPDQKDFYSLLSNVELSNKDYTKAQIVFSRLS